MLIDAVNSTFRPLYPVYRRWIFQKEKTKHNLYFPRNCDQLEPVLKLGSVYITGLEYKIFSRINKKKKIMNEFSVKNNYAMDNMSWVGCVTPSIMKSNFSWVHPIQLNVTLFPWWIVNSKTYYSSEMERIRQRVPQYFLKTAISNWCSIESNTISQQFLKGIQASLRTNYFHIIFAQTGEKFDIEKPKYMILTRSAYMTGQSIDHIVMLFARIYEFGIFLMW